MPTDWWRGAVIYQIYIRGFGDGDGDGIGDVAGIRARLPYLARLGVDAIWITPWYPSPMADGGYDVADYRDIDPVLGTLAEADTLIAEAHQHGLRVILDIVPNHTSSAHPWFQAALGAAPGSAERERYLFRDGSGAGGDLPPNNWRSVFGGPAWTRVPDGQWYLHMFAPGQPDLNWAEPAVRAEFEDILRFWFDRGVDGFRIDVANRMAKDPALPDLAGPVAPGQHPYQDRDEVHDIYRGWRRVADSYDPPRVFVAEAWMQDQDRFALYVRGDELHTAFNFDFLTTPWDCAATRDSIDGTLARLRRVDAPATWVLSNHDVVRHLSRFGRPPHAQGRGAHFVQLNALADSPLDIELGTRRARAAALLLLALPGSGYVYQGDELGLWEVEDLPDDVLQDPTWEQSGRTNRGRDGCRVPLPWSGDGPPFGFGPPGSSPWLPQPSAWKALTAARQEEDPGSMLSLYRTAIALRGTLDVLGDGPLAWLPDVPDGVLAFLRGRDFVCAVNYSAAEPWPLPAGASVLLASGPLPDGRLPADTGVWLEFRGR
ncbi:MAG TPA: alpha-amylase family glycosyl hydrolase [Streptosporangiaceae bacterium]|nr:alpha-amylase family glycosyl hydrolase [Streptosporangiaceae bacterium]